jgi:arylsulfatase A-like enzyme
MEPHVKRLLAAATLTLVLVSLIWVSVPEEKPPVILVSIDTFRADRVTAAGYERNITPHLDRFINDSYYFENTYANSPWTLPSHATVFTGKYPSRTGALEWHFRVCNDSTTLAEIAKKQGYSTYSSNGDAAISSLLGFSQGFDTYNESEIHLYKGNFESTARWLSARREQPSFAFVHGYDVHEPYLVPGKKPVRYLENGSFPNRTKRWKNFDRGDRDELAATKNDEDISERELRFTRNMYDNGVYYMDASFGNFTERLKEQGVYDDALIIVFSDHGEELGEHGTVGHSQMYQETIRTFLAVKYPGQKEGHHVRERAELRDIYPTVVRLMGGRYRGTAIPLKELAGGKSHDSIFAERSDIQTVVEGDYKLIEHVNSSRREIYNLEKDPEESRNLKDEELYNRLKSKLENYPERNYSSYCSSGFTGPWLDKNRTNQDES